MADNKGQYSLTDLAPTPAPAKPKQQGQFSESDLALNQQDALEPKQGDPDYSGIKEYAATGLEDLGNLIPNAWNLGGRFLSHPIDTTVQTVNSFLNFPDTFANEWTSGHPGRALMHASELALPEVLGRAPGAMRAVADSDAFQAIKGGVKGGYEGAMAPVEFTRFGMPITLPASVVGGAAGGLTTSWLPSPLRYAGPAIGAATPLVRGVIGGAKEAMLGAGSEEAELNALAREHFNKPFSALKGDDAETIQQLRRVSAKRRRDCSSSENPCPTLRLPT